MSGKLTVLCSLYVLSGALFAGNPYDNPALNPVKWEKTLSHAPLELVKDGKLDFAIVADLETEKNAKTMPGGIPVSKDAHSIRIAAEALQDAFERTTGNRPAVLPPDSPEIGKHRYKILLGQSRLTDALGIKPSEMPVEGFEVRTLSDGVAIVGRDGAMEKGFHEDYDGSLYRSNGTANGAYDFIERFLGMRFYYPGIGVIVPEIKTLTISSVRYTDSPVCRWRALSRLNSGFKDRKTKQLAKPDGRPLPQDVFIWDNVKNDQKNFVNAYRAHKSSRFFCLETPHPFVLAKEFPDKIETIFYRDPQTKELYYSPSVYSKNYYDTSNPAFADVLVEYFKIPFKHPYDANGKWAPKGWNGAIGIPNSKYLAFGPVDTRRVIDNERTAGLPKQKERQAAMSEVNARFYVELAERVKKEFPGKILTVMAYSNYLLPPVGTEKFPDNVQVMVCTGSPAFIRSTVCEKFFRETFDAWKEKTSRKPGAYTYNTHAMAGIFLRGCYEGEFLRKMASSLDFECILRDGAFPGWSFHVSIYLAHRSLWNPDFNVEAALDEYWVLMYGKEAAVPLKEFFNLVRDRWENHYLKNVTAIEKRSIVTTDRQLYYGKAFTPKVADELQSQLDSARKKVKPASIEEQRLHFFSKCWMSEFQAIRAFSLLKMPEYRIPFLESDGSLTVDGVLNEKEWRNAAKIHFRPILLDKKASSVQPDARMLWSRGGIYLGFRAPSPYRKAADSPWGGDNMEFFLAPGDRNTHIYHFVYSPGGAYQDYHQALEMDCPFDEKWNAAGVRKAVHAGEKEWSCEIFIPFAALEGGKAPLPGDRWRGNVVSNRTEPHENTAFSQTLGNNRDSSYFGQFYFCGNCE